MKKITKTFYVSDDFFKLVNEGVNINAIFEFNCDLKDEKSDFHKNQIQISWQEPEKKIEITESDCVARLMKHNWYSKEDAEFICSRIFGAENEL